MALLKRTGVLLVALVLGLSLCWAPAIAGKSHKKRHGWKTRVTLTHPSDTQFTGAVSSKLRACRKQRLVRLFYTDPATGQTQPLAVDRTDKGGAYRMDLPKPAFGGTYQAQAPKVSKRGVQMCRGGWSNTIVVPAVPLTP